MATYHRGELTVQDRAGLAEQASFSLGGIGAVVPDVAAAFLAEQPMIVVGGADAAGQIWSTLLTGEPGFLSAPDQQTLTIDARPLPGDPLAKLLGEQDAKVGMIAIEPATRRRMRINGTSRPTERGLRVTLDQVIANCPKYLQKRDFTLLPQYEWQAGTPQGLTTELSTAQQLAVTTADTFFVSTTSPAGDADASHRGGNPGFVQVLSPTHLRWPDYIGNAMFLTLGNLELHPEAGLVFPDWETGSMLQLTGTAQTNWDTDERARIPGAQRLVDFYVTGVQETPNALPLRWSEPGYSRFNPPTV